MALVTSFPKVGEIEAVGSISIVRKRKTNSQNKKNN